MKKLIRTFSLLLALVLPAPMLAQDSSTDSSSNQNVDLPYEIIVTPTLRRGDLRNLLESVENDFIAKFNELNIDDDYDIICDKIAPTGSHIRKRICEPNFYIQLRAENSKEYTDSLISGGSGFLMSSRALRKETEREFQTLQTKVDELMQKDKEFKEIGSVLAEMKYRVENYGKED